MVKKLEWKGFLEHYNRIMFEGRSFFIPRQFPATVSASNGKLEIYFKNGVDENAYCLVNGIRCSSYVMYSKDKNNKSDADTVYTFIKDYTYDGIQYENPLTLSVKFKFDDIECVYAGHRVVPQRHYDELATSFLSENPQLDSRIHLFLQKHPECFGNGSNKYNLTPNYVGDWINLNNELAYLQNEGYRRKFGDIALKDSGLEDDVLQLFLAEAYNSEDTL